MAVHKIAVTTTVFIQADTLSEAVGRIDEMSLEDLAEEINTGDMVGDSMKIVSSETVAPDRIEDELLAIGSDGSFFADELPRDEEDEEDEDR